jgi:hypothetical protein
MTINLYSTGDNPKTVSKTLTAISSVQGRATQPCNILRPELILSGDSTVNAINANYVYVPDFGRYYFVKDHTTDTAARIILSCEVDPLMSWAAGIRASKQLVTRSESVGKPTEITDNQYPLSKRKNMFVIAFEGGSMNLDSATADTYNFIINVAGGAGE